MKPLNHIATFLDRYGARGSAESIWLKLKESPNATTSSVAYQSLGEQYLRDSRCTEALSIYQESMAKLKDVLGDGKQCYAATLVCASSAAMKLNNPELANRYLAEVFELNGIEDWILDWAGRKLPELPKPQTQQEGSQPAPSPHSSPEAGSESGAA
jgi:hypothetical protein